MNIKEEIECSPSHWGSHLILLWMEKGHNLQ